MVQCPEQDLVVGDVGSAGGVVTRQASLPGRSCCAGPVDATPWGNEAIAVGLVAGDEAVAGEVENLAGEGLGENIAEVFEAIAGGQLLEHLKTFQAAHCIEHLPDVEDRGFRLDANREIRREGNCTDHAFGGDVPALLRFETGGFDVEILAIVLPNLLRDRIIDPVAI